jgi:hypothetical protein
MNHQPSLFGPPVFGRDRLPRKEAETAPAWPSLADVARKQDRDRAEKVRKVTRW